ncbi:LPXTG cell wall anchor domain-containing protein [Actinoplanes sp. CA-051413]|uniref:LPXTG cell wall anchor domain-containing protein n=1 Tax=Actinoplanes sp. CA-051413 TaxID=3239899 RepID=UPI003D98177F
MKSKFPIMALASVMAALLSTAPAQAQAPADLRVEISDTVVAPGGATRIWLRTYSAPAQSVQANSVSYRISQSLVDAGVTVDIDYDTPNCTGGVATLSCSFEDEFFDFTPAGERSHWAVLKAAASVPVGTEGTITATFRGYHDEVVTGVADVTVAEGVSLVAVPSPTLSAQPGEPFEVPLSVRNAGANVADGIGMSVDRSAWAMQAGTRYRNCRYDADRLVSCSFDQQLQPGTAYRLALPYRLRSNTIAPVNLSANFTWRTTAQHDGYLAEEKALGKPAGTAGDGPVLRLEPFVSAAAKRQADVDYRDSTSRVRIAVTGRNGVDLVALGAEVDGDAGDVVTAAVGVRNDGPAVLDLDQSTTAARMLVSVPEGTEVVTVPARCRQVVDGVPAWNVPAKPGAAQYGCRTSNHLEVGASEKFRFGLRINRVITGASGPVQVTAACGTCELDKANDKALITINGAGGGGGGGLPVTGTPIAAVAGAALLLLLAGTGGVLLTRRHRTRFQA